MCQYKLIGAGCFFTGGITILDKAEPTAKLKHYIITEVKYEAD